MVTSGYGIVVDVLVFSSMLMKILKNPGNAEILFDIMEVLIDVSEVEAIQKLELFLHFMNWVFRKMGKLFKGRNIQGRILIKEIR